MLPNLLPLMSLAGFTAIAVTAAVWDFKRKSIPNGLVLTLIAGFLLLAPGSGWTQAEITGSLLAGSIVVFVGLTIHALGWAGAGDGKFAAACTLWIGAAQALDFLFLTTVFGALFTMTLLGANRLGWSPLSPEAPATGHRQITIPYGFALSAAALVVLPQSPWM